MKEGVREEAMGKAKVAAREVGKGAGEETEKVAVKEEEMEEGKIGRAHV